MDGTTVVPAHDPSVMRDVWQRHFAESTDTPLLVRDCRIINTRRRDGTRGTVEYDLTLEDSASGEIRNQRASSIAFGGDRTRRVWESLRQRPIPDAVNRGELRVPPYGYAPDLDALLQVFPYDHRLPALARLMAGPPSALVPVLQAEFGDAGCTLSGWRTELVQYRVDMRASLLVTVQATDEDGQEAERRLFAKIYRDGNESRRAFETQFAVSSRAAEAGGTLVAARTVAHLDEMHTVVTEALPGASLSRIIRRGEDSARAIKLAARAVAQFHQLPVDAPPRPVADEVARLREAEALLVAERPDLADAIASTVRTVSERLQDAPAAPIHGDLKPDHILVDGDRVALLDFDLVAVADPVADVAHLAAFLAKPQERARDRRQGDVDASAVFIDEYFRCVPSTWRDRLPAHHALTAIHKAVGLSRRRGAEGQARLGDVIREAESILSGNTGASVPSFKRRMTRNAGRTP